MIPLGKMNDRDFERHALAVLQRELGLDCLARFLRLYRSGTGDYTRDRRRWLESATIQEIMAKSNGTNRSPSCTLFGRRSIVYAIAVTCPRTQALISE
jgi:hypothetical protein